MPKQFQIPASVDKGLRQISVRLHIDIRCSRVDRGVNTASARRQFDMGFHIYQALLRRFYLECRLLGIV